MKLALENLGVGIDELERKDKSEFEKKQLDDDVINLRYKHYQARLIDTINRALEERRRIKAE